MKMIKRVGCLLSILVLLLGGCLVSCETVPTPPTGGTNASEATGGTETPTEDITPEPPDEPAREILIAEEGTVNFAIIYPEDAADDVKESVTFLYNAVKKLSNEGLTQTMSADLKSYSADTYEILVGDTGYPESNEVMNGIGYGDWIVRFCNNKLVVTGYSRDAVRAAITEVIQAIKDNADDDGTITFMSDLVISGTKDAMANMMPRYDSASYPKTADEGQDTSLAVISGTTVEEYTAYLNKLETEGYTFYTSNTIGENRFATYQSNDYVIHAGYYAYESAARVTVEKKTNLVGLESDNVWTANSSVVTSVAQFGLGTVANNGAYNGMAYCYQLADGSFIVIDGGFYSDADRLYDYMKAKAPNGDVVIAAWFITHNDGDHTQGFATFCTKYKNAVKVEMVVKNFPNSFLYMECGGNENLAAQTGAESLPGCKVVKAHTGQKFYIRNAVVEILYTLDSYLPRPLTIFNNSSLVFTVETEGERVLYMGDASDEVGGLLLPMYGDYLKCDILQIAHHGLRNGHGLNMPNTVKLYQAMRPEIILWPSTEAHYLNNLNQDTSYQIALHSWNVEAMKSAREVYIAGDRITVLELPYRFYSAYKYDPNAVTTPVRADQASTSDSLTYAEACTNSTIDRVNWND